MARRDRHRRDRFDRQGQRRLGAPGEAVKLRPGDPLPLPEGFELDPDPLGMKERGRG